MRERVEIVSYPDPYPAAAGGLHHRYAERVFRVAVM